MGVDRLAGLDVAKHALKVMRGGGSLILNSSVVGLTSDAQIAT